MKRSMRRHERLTPESILTHSVTSAKEVMTTCHDPFVHSSTAVACPINRQIITAGKARE